MGGGERQGKLADGAFTGFRNSGSSWREGGAFLCLAGQEQQCLGTGSLLSGCRDMCASKGTRTFVCPWPCPAGDSRVDSNQVPGGLSSLQSWLGGVTCSCVFFEVALTEYTSVSQILGLRSRFLWRCGILKVYIWKYTTVLAFSFGLQFCEF